MSVKPHRQVTVISESLECSLLFLPWLVVNFVWILVWRKEPQHQSAGWVDNSYPKSKYHLHGTGLELQLGILLTEGNKNLIWEQTLEKMSEKNPNCERKNDPDVLRLC